jgi:hypothetical protein
MISWKRDRCFAINTPRRLTGDGRHEEIPSRATATIKIPRTFTRFVSDQTGVRSHVADSPCGFLRHPLGASKKLTRQANA